MLLLLPISPDLTVVLAAHAAGADRVLAEALNAKPLVVGAAAAEGPAALAGRGDVEADPQLLGAARVVEGGVGAELLAAAKADDLG